MRNNQASSVEKILKNQISSLMSLSEDSLRDSLKIWRSRTHRFLQGKVIDEELAIFNDINADTYQNDRERYKEFLEELIVGIKDTPDMYLAPLPAESVSSQGKSVRPKPSLDNSNVFIVHGHGETEKLDVAGTIEKMGLSATILHEQPNQGRTIIEKFESKAAEVGFAVILLTPDDVGYAKGKESEQKPRARQNVILELGYFAALLGRNRVAVLYKGNVEIPGDYLGVVYTPMDEAGSWKFALAKEMKTAGIDIDLNTLV